MLRYLTDAYRALRSTVPTSARTEELDDIVEWLGEVVRHTDSSLLDEWEALANPSDEPLTEVRVPSENRALSANPRALRVMVRQSMFRRIELVSLGRFAALAALDGGLTQDEWAQATAAGYRAEYDDLGTGPAGAWPGVVPGRRGARRPLGRDPDPRGPRRRPRLADHGRARPRRHRRGRRAGAGDDRLRPHLSESGVAGPGRQVLGQPLEATERPVAP